MTDLQLLSYLETFVSPERKARFSEILKLRTRHFTVAMEEVYQMHNASALIRSCEVFGIQDVHLIQDGAGRQLDRKIALGAQKWIDIQRHKGAGACMEWLRARGYRIVATVPEARGTSLADFDISPRSALIFGSETKGLSREILEGADGFLSIPMAGFTKSLNISVAAGIILQELCERLRASAIPWGLSEAEMLQKRMEWIKKSIKSLGPILDRYKPDE